jgi:hypothetical protein
MFPDPKAMIDKIHSLGYTFGLWVTFWVNPTDPEYNYLAQQGYLLKSKTDPTQPCKVSWFGGTGAGIVDLANPAANQWYKDQLNTLMKTYGVNGFKFDTQFFDDTCAPYKAGLTDVDYANFGAQLANNYDLQGAGIRVHWTGAQKYGFVVREVDKGTSFISLQAAVKQVTAISTIGYPFVETDYIGGSLEQPLPTKQVLVRWAQAAALMPFMYSGISPLGALNVGGDGKWHTYDAQTIQLYKDAVLQHGRLTPYILQQANLAVATGEPIVRPLFFDFPNDQATYSIGDEWMLGPAVLAAPDLSDGDSRDVHLPPGNWYDVNQGRMIKGPVNLKNYSAPLDVTPTFVLMGTPGADEVIRALARTDVAPVSVHINFPSSDQLTVGQATTVTVTASDWGKQPAQNIAVNLSATGWQIAGSGSSTFSPIQPGATKTATYQVTVPANTKWGPVTATAHATYTEANTSSTATETTSVLVVPTPDNSSVKTPFLTYANVQAQYAESADQSQFALFTQGQDLFEGTDQKSQIYEQQTLGSQQTVTVRVATIQGGGPNAKAGIVINTFEISVHHLIGSC